MVNLGIKLNLYLIMIYSNPLSTGKYPQGKLHSKHKMEGFWIVFFFPTIWVSLFSPEKLATDLTGGHRCWVSEKSRQITSTVGR